VGLLTAGGDPLDVAAASDGSVYVAAQTTSVLYRYEPRQVTGSATSIALDGLAGEVAVSADDTVYASMGITRRLAIINPGSAAIDDSLSVSPTFFAGSLAVSSDDTVYSSDFSTDSVAVIAPGNVTGPIDDTLALSTPGDIAINSDDTVYVADQINDIVGVFSRDSVSGSPVRTITVGDNPTGLAVTSDDTLYATSANTDRLVRVNPGGSSVDATVPVGTYPWDVVVGPAGRVLVSNSAYFALASSSISVVDPDAFTVEQTVDVYSAGCSSPRRMAMTVDDLVYVACYSSANVAVLAEVGASLATTTGSAGSAGLIDVTGLAPDVLVDDSVVTAVYFDGVASGTWTRVTGTNSFTGTIPAGSGSRTVTVGLNGGGLVEAGTFTYTAPPPPPPVYPASAPLEVTGVAGDGAVSVSWSAPVSSGSFPVSSYQVMSSPAGGSCLVSVTSCEVAGLSNGVGYSFRVRALNGAGWGPWSAASAEVTPVAPVVPSIVITGVRGEVRGKPGIVVTGVSTLELGAVVRPWVRFPGQTSYVEGSAQVLVDESGGFMWERRTGKKTSVFVTAGSLRSNRVIIR